MNSVEMKEIADLEQKIQILRRGLQKARDLRNKALTQKEILEEQREKILAKIAEFGIKPEELDSKIAELKQEMESLIKEVHELIPWELIKA